MKEKVKLAARQRKSALREIQRRVDEAEKLIEDPLASLQGPMREIALQALDAIDADATYHSLRRLL